MTAALYASRAGLDTILLEHDAPGGKLLKTSEIANWPGALLQDGADLALKMSEQAAAAGARHIYGKLFPSAVLTAGRTGKSAGGKRIPSGILQLIAPIPHPAGRRYGTPG